MFGWGKNKNKSKSKSNFKQPRAAPPTDRHPLYKKSAPRPRPPVNRSRRPQTNPHKQNKVSASNPNLPTKYDDDFIFAQSRNHTNNAKLILSQNYTDITIKTQNSTKISSSKQQYVWQSGQLLGSMRYMLPVINFYKIKQSIDKTVYYQLSKGTNDNDDVPSKDVPLNTQNIAVIRTMPEEVSVILNKESFSLEQNILDYSYPGKMQSIIETVNPNNTTNEELKLLVNIDNDNSEFEAYKIRVHNLIDPALNCRHSNTLNNFVFIPTTFNLSDMGKIKIISEINNLSRILYPNVYDLMASIFKYMIPMFRWILHIDTEALANRSYFNSFHETHPIEYHQYGDTDLKVVVKMQTYELLANESFSGELHRELDGNDNIVAVAMYIYDSQNIESIFEICQQFQYATNCFDEVTTHVVQKIKINKNDVMVFNNKHGVFHRLALLRNNGVNICKLKILYFYLTQEVKPTHVTQKMSNNIAAENQLQVVNNYDKYLFIVKSWIRKIFIDENDLLFSSDLITLIIFVACNMDLCEQRKIRDVLMIRQSFDARGYPCTPN